MQAAGEDLLENLSFFSMTPEKILDLGCGTGFFLSRLQSCYPNAEVIGIDFSKKMLEKISSPHRKIFSTAENITLESKSVDMIFSNLLFPWISDPHTVISEVFRVLKPGGVFIFSSLGPDTFKELITHQIFPDMHDLGDALVKTHFMEPVMQAQYFEFKYSNQEKMQDEFKFTGLNYFFDEVDKESNIVTFELVYGHAFKSVSQETSGLDETGIAKINVADIPVRKHKSENL